MNFTLYYRGRLKSHGNAEEKHALRKLFHPQLKALWQQEPLSYFEDFYKNAKPDYSITKQIGCFKFVPVICRDFLLVARINITLLRADSPGSIVTNGGDIDNRLKTLLDSLKIPSEPSALPSDAIPLPDNEFFFCLLEDDSLITELSINTKQLLGPTLDKNEVIVILDIETIKTGTLMGGMELP